MLITCPKCSTKYKIPSEIKLTDGKKMQCSACQHVFVFHSEERLENPQNTDLIPPEDAVLSVKTRTEKLTVKMPEPSIPSEKPVLPEVFRPIHIQKTSSTVPYFWILLCAILLIGFMSMAWLYRELLMNQVPLMPSLPRVQHVERKETVPVVLKAPKKVVIDNNDTDVTIPQKIKEVPVIEENFPVLQPQQIFSVQSVRFRKTPTGDAILIEGTLKNITTEIQSVPEKIYALAYDAKGGLAFEKEIYLPSGVLYPDMEQPFFGTYAPVQEEIQWVDVVLKK